MKSCVNLKLLRLSVLYTISQRPTLFAKNNFHLNLDNIAADYFNNQVVGNKIIG